jgi:hypothetical protein
LDQDPDKKFGFDPFPDLVQEPYPSEPDFVFGTYFRTDYGIEPELDPGPVSDPDVCLEHFPEPDQDRARILEPDLF